MTSPVVPGSFGRQRRVSLRHRATTAATVTSSAAEDAVQQLLQRRALRRDGRVAAGHRRGDRPGGWCSDLPVARWLLSATVVAVTGVMLLTFVFHFIRQRPPVPLHPFSVNVVVGDTVPVGARVVLHPRSRPLPHAAVPQGTVREDGSVSFVTYPPASGVPAGDYVATVEWFRVAADGSVGGNAVPARYSLRERSPLVVTVMPDAAGHETLRIARK